METVCTTFEGAENLISTAVCTHLAKMAPNDPEDSINQMQSSFQSGEHSHPGIRAWPFAFVVQKETELRRFGLGMLTAWRFIYTHQLQKSYESQLEPIFIDDLATSDEILFRVNSDLKHPGNISDLMQINVIDTTVSLVHNKYVFSCMYSNNVSLKRVAREFVRMALWSPRLGLGWGILKHTSDELRSGEPDDSHHGSDDEEQPNDVDS